MAVVFKAELFGGFWTAADILSINPSCFRPGPRRRRRRRLVAFSCHQLVLLSPARMRLLLATLIPLGGCQCEEHK
eukprot:CAMPEP_0172916702 /NCGR_PEP_ID=MMETSP1075-20121228/196880_1 /TAXON_ID=2916 /ORGANISM="Ceratium fusus, Strain PA161109" /LENGTH=74 /DNA_ID=CAMNT_0013776045 /DNA_START=234 /DNA_END=458 /DNA_ORIENTATION=+